MIILIVALIAYAQITMLIPQEIDDDFYTIIKQSYTLTLGDPGNFLKHSTT